MVNVQNLSAATSIDLLGGAEQLTVFGSAAPLTVTGASNSATVTLDRTGQVTGENIAIASNADASNLLVSDLGLGNITLQASNLVQLNVNLGSGNNALSINNLATNPTISINGGNGDDAIHHHANCQLDHRERRRR